MPLIKYYMVHDTHVKHHKNVRKRIHEKFERYPHPEKRKKIIDTLVYVAGFFGLAMTIPQIMKIWIEKNASGVSAISWGSYFVIGLVMISYAVVHKEKPLIVTYVLWEIFYVFIIAGALIYG